MQQLPQPSPPGPRPNPTPVAASLGEPCSGRQWSETNYYFNWSDATSRLPIPEIRARVWGGGGRKENLTSLITTSKYKIKVELSRKYIPPPQSAWLIFIELDVAPPPKRSSSWALMRSGRKVGFACGENILPTLMLSHRAAKEIKQSPVFF